MGGGGSLQDAVLVFDEAEGLFARRDSGAGGGGGESSAARRDEMTVGVLLPVHHGAGFAFPPSSASGQCTQYRESGGPGFETCSGVVPQAAPL